MFEKGAPYRNQSAALDIEPSADRLLRARADAGEAKEAAKGNL